MDGTSKHLAARYDAAAKGWQGKIAPLGYPAAYVELVQQPGRLDAAQLDVLDAGAGCADFSSAFVRGQGAPKSLTLLDISADMLKAAGKRLDVEVTCVTGDIESCEASQAFDVILCAHVIEHCDEPLAALKVLHRALRPGGWLLLVASKPHWCTALIRLIWRNKAFHPEKMRGLLLAAGFEQVEAKGFNSGPPSRTSMGYIAKKERENDRRDC
jgi:ubiquinone/menaquinone biosynthesis C-methylase UbiE